MQKNLSRNGGYTPPSPKIFQRGLKLAFLAKTSCFLEDFFLSGIGGSPHPPDQSSESTHVSATALQCAEDTDIKTTTELDSEEHKFAKDKFINQQDNLSMNYSTGLNNHLRSIDRFR